MRRRASLVLIGLAAFLAAFGLLMHWYVYPRVAAIPDNQYQVEVLTADDATLIDYSTMTSRPHQKVTIVQTLKGDAASAQRYRKQTGRDVVVWDSLSYILDTHKKMLSAIPETYVFDARTQVPVHCCGESVDGDRVSRSGIEFKFPFGTQCRDYQYYDPQTRSSAPIHCRGRTTYDGVPALLFEETVPWTRVPFPKHVAVAGITPAQINAMGMQRWYTTVRRFWIDPVTGAPLQGTEQHDEEMRFAAAAGQPAKPPVTIFKGYVHIRPDFLASTDALVKKERTLVLALSAYVPWGMGAAALLVLALALWLEARDRLRRAPAGEVGEGVVVSAAGVGPPGGDGG
jgi:hypothetical protein